MSHSAQDRRVRENPATGCTRSRSDQHQRHQDRRNRQLSRTFGEELPDHVRRHFCSLDGLQPTGSAACRGISSGRSRLPRAKARVHHANMGVDPTCFCAWNQDEMDEMFEFAVKDPCPTTGIVFRPRQAVEPRSAADVAKYRGSRRGLSRRSPAGRSTITRTCRFPRGACQGGSRPRPFSTRRNREIQTPCYAARCRP